MYWPKLSPAQIKQQVFDALAHNANYRSESILGLPGTFLDSEIFNDDAPFLEDAPFLSTLIANPNHIGCHTLGEAGEAMFQGTQQLEKDLIRICAEEIFGGKPGEQDGYVASGGTEANIQAMWVYRNYFQRTKDVPAHKIGVLFSEDTHYSIPKGIDLLGLQPLMLRVDPISRGIYMTDLADKVQQAMKAGIHHFIVIMNLSTTMFGSVDDIEAVTDFLDTQALIYRVHVDAAFGGFIYPFTNPDSPYTFKNPHICSFSIDGHKMQQAPYGTGIFLVRKGWMQYVCTEEASYVQGKDYTLCGSRSGANAISVWMILHQYGAEGWKNKMQELLKTTDTICQRLDVMEIPYYRNPTLNIITIPADCLSAGLARRFYLVPDRHDGAAAWYKIVVMSHVQEPMLRDFFNELSEEHLKLL